MAGPVEFNFGISRKPTFSATGDSRSPDKKLQNSSMTEKLPQYKIEQEAKQISIRWESGKRTQIEFKPSETLECVVEKEPGRIAIITSTGAGSGVPSVWRKRDVNELGAKPKYDGKIERHPELKASIPEEWTKQGLVVYTYPAELGLHG